MCSHHTPFVFDIPANVRRWIACATVSALAIHVSSFSDPVDILIYGILIGVLIVWAQQIGYEWLKGKQVCATGGVK